MGIVRIIAGRFKGRRIAAPPGQGTRPAANAHRESVMASLGPDFEGLHVLDFFAGSGAFALECLSRGAAYAVLVERHREALRVLRGNLKTLGVGASEARVVAGDAYRISPPGGPFDIVFVAPPYPHFRGPTREALLGLLARLREGEAPLLADEGTVVVQSEAGDFAAAAVPGLVRDREKRYGRTDFTFLRAEEEDDEGGGPAGA